MPKDKIIVGFDMDGVLLYNPARIARPLIAFVKRYFLKRKTNKFYLPKNKWERFIFNLLHKTSFFIADGFDDAVLLIKKKHIEAYIITSRYEFLRRDTKRWFEKINKDGVFKDCIYNDGNEQPFIYKERKIGELKPNYFVEDNWDIVKHLNTYIREKNLKTKVLWIYNVLDRNIKYPYKFPSLKAVVEYMEKEMR